MSDPFITQEEILDEAKELEKTPVHVRNYACTVVNLLPRDILEEKPHMLPGAYLIPAAKWGSVAILHVEEAIHYVPNPLIDDGKPGSSIKQITPPREVARSLCEDYNCAHVATGDTAGPSLFWVEGRLTANEIKQYHKDKLEKARASVKAWFHNLCAMADADFTKNRNMMAVSDLQRMAARALGITREWVEFQIQETISCKFCTTSIPPLAIVCPNCRQVLNQGEFNKLGGKSN
jgi:hypothetical protein